MDEIILDQPQIQKIGQSDPLYAGKLRESRLSLIHLLRQIPGHIQTILNSMHSGDTYRARIPKEVLAKLQRGEYEKVMNKDAGLWTGIIRKSDGKEFVCHTNWDRINLSQQTLSNLTSVALQASIAELTEQLLEMDSKLDLIISLAHSDRVAKVEAGINMYKKAMHYDFDKIKQDRQIEHALQSLNEGQTCLMEELKAVFKNSSRKVTLLDKYWWQLIMRVNKPEVDSLRNLQKHYEMLQDAVKYINLSFIYIFRIHLLLGAFGAATESRTEYIHFCTTLLDGLDKRRGYLPYKFVSNIQGFETLSNLVHSSLSMPSDLIVEVTYKEISDENLQTVRGTS